MLGTVKGVREADNKAKTYPGAHGPPDARQDYSFVYKGALRWARPRAENGLTHKQVPQRTGRVTRGVKLEILLL